MPETETLDRAAPPTAGYYIYGISRPEDAEGSEPAAGIGGAPVEAVVDQSLAAVVSEIRPGDTTWASAPADPADPAGQGSLEEAIRAHEAVVESVLSAGSVVPMRFGSVYPSREAVKAMLRREHDHLEAVLTRLSGSAEWSLRVTWDPQLAFEAVLQATKRDDATPPPSPGHAYLASRRAERQQREELTRLRLDCAASLHDRLSADAVAATRHSGPAPGGPSGRELLLAASYLVRRGDETGLAGAVESELARGEAFDMRGELTGPWPAYHFASVPEGGQG